MNSLTDDMRDVGAWGQATALAFRFLLVGAFAIALGWLVSNIRQIPPDSQAIILRFGVVDRIRGPGLLLALPRPIEQVTVIPSSARQLQFTIERFVDTDEPAATQNTAYGFDLSASPRMNSGFLLSGDSSVVHLEARLFYQITDPQAYLVAMDTLAPTLQRLFVASAVNTVAARDLDTVLVARPEIASRSNEASRREHLRIDLVSSVNRRLEKLAEQGVGLGVTVNRVDLVPSIPSGAKSAFDSVLVVTQEAESGIANARTAAELVSQDASRVRDRVVTDATARAEEQVANATVATASIAALAKNTQDMSHGMLMSRLYYDRIIPIVKKAGRVELIGRDGTARLLLPGAIQ